VISASGANTAAEAMRSARLFAGEAAPASPGLEMGSTFTTGSGPGLRGQATEPALALLVFPDRRLKRGAVEVRPVGRHEHQFAVGRLPEQEIRQPLFAARANDKIGIGDIRRVHEPTERLHGDVGRLDTAFDHLLGNTLRRARDFLARAVI